MSFTSHRDKERTLVPCKFCPGQKRKNQKVCDMCHAKTYIQDPERHRPRGSQHTSPNDDPCDNCPTRYYEDRYDT